MNRVILMGRLTRDPDVRYSQGGEGSMAVARYTLAVDRRRTRSNESSNEQTADFISCVAFARSAEFAEKYLHQGTKVVVSGRIQTQIRTDREFTRLMWSLTTRNSQRAKLQQQAAKLRIHHQEVIRQHLQVMAL